MVRYIIEENISMISKRNNQTSICIWRNSFVLFEFVFVFLVFSERGNVINFKPKWAQFYSVATAQAQTATFKALFLLKIWARLLSEIYLFHTLSHIVLRKNWSWENTVSEPLHHAFQVLQYSTCKCMRNFLLRRFYFCPLLYNLADIFQ